MSLDTSEAKARYRDGFVTVADGLRLHYRDYQGAAGKPPLLCLHGLTRNARDFAGFAERYSPVWRVIAPDFRGRGDSDPDPLPARYTPLTYASDILQMLDQLGIGEAVFVGTSLGGLVTMAIGAMAPQRIAATILNDVGPVLNTTGLDRIRDYVGKGGQFRNWEEAADAIRRNVGSAHPKYGEADWVKMARRLCREERGRIIFDYDLGIAQPFEAKGAVPKIDLWPLFKTLGEKPLLVVRGAISELLTAATLQKMHEAAPRMKSVTVPDVGHAPMLDEPEAAAAIDQFLAALDA
jgi:pimeloyl-ACP methyl ester carboxylesterase